MLICLYAAYWAFDIRKVLAVRLYRSQALGIGLVALSFALLNTDFFLNNTEPALTAALPPVLGALLTILTLSPFILIFNWTDSSVSAAQRSDPILRDILAWTRIRIVLWPLIILSLVIYVLIPAVTGNLYTSCSPNCTTPFGIFVGILYSAVFYIPIFVPLAGGTIYLPLSVKRSKDATLRRHLRWFGFFAAAIFVAGLFFAFFPQITLVLFIVGAYCLYRSAKSLVPLNRLSLEIETK